MAQDYQKIKKGINLQPVAGPTLTNQGDVAYDSTADKLQVRGASSTDPVVQEAKSQTLTGKSATDLIITDKLRLTEQGSSPATPASGFGVVYEKSDGVLYFKGDDGIEHNLLTSVASNQFAASVGTITGFSTHTTIAAAIAATAANDVIYIAQGTYNETITLSSPRRFEGAGYGAKINGVFTVASGADKSIIERVNFLDNVVINATVAGIFITSSYQATGKSITDNGDVNQNLITVFRE